MFTRRRFLQAAGGAATWVALGGVLGCDPVPRARATAASAPAGQAWNFRSRPDLHPPVIEVIKQARDTAPGYIFIAPKNGPEEAGPGQDGCMIVDNDGQPVWMRLLQKEEMDVMNFKVQTYKGERVLTWWEGVHTGYGQGEYVIFDHSYRQIARFGAANGYEGDHHEFLITPEDTALITIYTKVPMDLSGVGGPVDGLVLEGMVQELDIQSGKLIFEWHSLDHIGLEESMYEPSAELKGAFDYFHINSIDPMAGSYLLISARRTSAVYKVDRNSGEIIWRLGGKYSDFHMGAGVRTALQHDARYNSDGTITIFDNGNVNRVDQSRGIVLEVDEDKMSATLVGEYTHPDRLLSDTQGNVQVLPNGNVFVGWGSAPFFSEFDHHGKLLFHAAFPTEDETYRAFRFQWYGQPTDDPAVAAESGPEDRVTIYASWNGATEVTTWQVLAGSAPDQLEPIASAPRQGFETVITVHTTEPYVGLQAVNGSGNVLGTSKAIKPEDHT
jgi:Arylsulfotransferase (ASST)